MATAPAKSPLHNFPLTFLKWGSKSSVNAHHRYRRPFDSPPHPPTHNDHANPKPSPRSHTLVETDADAEAERTADDQAQKHWNLRPRRPPPPPEIGGAGHVRNGECSPESESLPKSMRLRGLADGGGGGSERREKRKLWVSLTKDEIEEDIYSLTGAKPTRRPRKRPRNVQKQLDSVFPGLWLVGLSPEAYRSLDAQPKR